MSFLRRLGFEPLAFTESNHGRPVDEVQFDDEEVFDGRSPEFATPDLYYLGCEFHADHLIIAENYRIIIMRDSIEIFNLHATHLEDLRVAQIVFDQFFGTTTTKLMKQTKQAYILLPGKHQYRPDSTGSFMGEYYFLSKLEE